MRIIDLLNKIANGEEVPKKIKVLGSIYYYCGGDISGNCYYSEPEGCGGIRLSFNTSQLNNEVKILEEEKKIPEKLDVISWGKCINGVTHKEKELAIEINKTQETINEIIDYLDYLESKGE